MYSQAPNSIRSVVIDRYRISETRDFVWWKGYREDLDARREPVMFYCPS
jgi:hypothetical protein